MSWLAPWFLVGALAVALPLWLHRLQARNPQRRLFSSAMLLQPEEQRLRLQKQLRYRVLLALRMALLLALALAFAQPLWRGGGLGAPRSALTHLIVLDDSLSMSASGHLQAARQQARSLLENLHGERALLVVASDHVEPLDGGDALARSDVGALLASLQRYQGSAARLDYGLALAGLDTVLAGVRGAVSVDLISDFQNSGLPTRFADLLPPLSSQRTLGLQLHPVSNEAAANWAVSDIRRSGDGVDVVVRGFGTPARTLMVALTLNDAPRGSVAVAIPANGEGMAHFAALPLASGDNRVVATLAANDALAADDVRYQVISNTPALPVLMLGSAPEAPAPKYVDTAFRAAGGHYQLDRQLLGRFDARALPRYRWVIIEDLGAVDAALAGALRAFVADGGSLFAAVGAQAQAHPQLPLLDDAVQSPGAAPDQSLAVGQVDSSHPILGDARGWQSLSIAQMVRVTPAADDRVLVSTNDSRPLLLERRLGRGRMVLFTSTLDNDWNDLPVQPLFVSLMAQIGRYLDGRSILPASQTAGTRLALSSSGLNAGQVIDPSGQRLLSLSQTGRATSVMLDRSGFYRVYTPGQEALIAVNPDLRESDLSPIPASMMQRWRDAVAASPNASGPTTGAAAVPPRPLAPALLLLLAALVLAESLLGNWHLQRRSAGQFP